MKTNAKHGKAKNWSHMKNYVKSTKKNSFNSLKGHHFHGIFVTMSQKYFNGIATLITRKFNFLLSFSTSLFSLVCIPCLQKQIVTYLLYQLAIHTNDVLLAHN